MIMTAYNVDCPLVLCPLSSQHTGFLKMIDQQGHLRFYWWACSPDADFACQREKVEDAGIDADRAHSGKASITTVGPVTSAGTLMYPNPYLPWLMTASLPTLSALSLPTQQWLLLSLKPCARRCCWTANTTPTRRGCTYRDLYTTALWQWRIVENIKMTLEEN